MRQRHPEENRRHGDARYLSVISNYCQTNSVIVLLEGMLHCRTHLLWNKLIHHQDSNQLTYEEFIELTNFSKVENLCDLNTNLTSLLVHQPLTWYQGLTKLLLSKYHDQRRSYISPDGNVQHHVMLHPGYVGAFMMLKMDLHTNRGVTFVKLAFLN